MRHLTVSILVTLAVLLGSAGMSWSADFQKGLDAYNRGDYATALREWKPLAEQGDADAQFNLGVMYDEGEGVPQNDKTAVKWYTLAAKQGHASAQSNLGWMYRKGQGVSQNDKTAVKWFRLAAEQGNAPAQNNLGLMYHEGKGVPQDDKTAVKWFKLAAEQGTAGAQTSLGFMYEKGKGVPQNDKTAVKWWKLAAEQGDAYAQTNLGVMYDEGQGVPQNDKTAVKWYRLAAEQGDADAQTNLGLMYENGEGVVQDNVYAHMWWSIAASQGDKDAIKYRDIVAKKMTTSQLETAQKLARNFVPKKSTPVVIAQKVTPTVTAKKTPKPKPKPAKRIAKRPPPTKPSLPTAKARDTTPPTISIASAITVKTDSPTIKGRTSDNTQVAQVTVEGVAVDLKSDGSFTFSRYVPLGGTQVTIEAVDEWGNKAQKVVRLSRKAVQTAALSFASLDPTKIKGRSNKDALALIIGVANYSRAPAATFADNDANVFGDYAHRALGVPRSNIKVLVNNDTSRTELKIALKQWLRGRIEEGKTDVHVFFAGHGLASPDGKDLYLLPYDGEPSLLEETALLRRELFEVIGKAKPKSATIFLDTCYSGLSRGKETLLASARGIVVTPKPQSIPKGFTVLSAASGQQISSGLDEAKHGLFSYYLMKGMEGDADANKDRKITASELHAYLGKNVQKQAIRLGREQTPELSGDGERVLVRW